MQFLFQVHKAPFLYIINSNLRMFFVTFYPWRISDSSYRLNFDLGKKNEIHHYSYKDIIHKYTKFAKFVGLYFPHFATKLCNFTNFKLLFLAIVMDFVLLA